MFKKLLPLLIACTMLFTALFQLTAPAADPPLTNDEISEWLKTLDDQVRRLFEQMRDTQDPETWLPYITPYLESLRAPIEPKPDFPRIKLEGPYTTTLRTGVQNIELQLRNVGSGTAKNLSIKTDVPQGLPFIAYISENSFQSSISMGRGFSATLRLEPTGEGEPGIYLIPLSFTYFDNMGIEKTDTDLFFVQIKQNEDGISSSAVIFTDFFNSNPSASAGESFTLEAHIKNAGTLSAFNTQVAMEGLSAEGIYLDGGGGNQIWGSLNPGASETAVFKLKSAKNADGVYPINMKIIWQNANGDTLETVYPYFVVITAPSDGVPGKPRIKTGNITSPTANVTPGRDFMITIPVINDGDEAVPVTIKAIIAGDSIVPRSADTIVINSLQPGAAQNAVFTFMATDDATTRSYTIGFSIEAVNGTTESVFTQYAGVNVYNPKKTEEPEPDKIKSVPKIIISRYQSDPIVVRAGENFDLTIAFQNTHQERTIKNVKAYLTSPPSTEGRGNVFVPVNASNTFYIDEIAPKAENEKRLTFYTVPDAEPRNYIIMVNFEYEDNEGNPYESTEQFGINVKQTTRIDTSDINIPSEAFIGTPIPVYFDFYNTGRVKLNNLIIRIEGEFDTTNTTSYYSNFQPGAYDMYDMMFFPNEAGLKSGSVVFQYEDDSGETIIEHKEFTINVMDMGGYDPMFNDPGFDMPYTPDDDFRIGESESEGGFSGFIKKPAVIITGSAVLLAIIITIILIIRNKRRKAKEREQDE